MGIREQLIKPFKKNQIEWKHQSAGIKSNGEAWCLVSPYVTARAIQNRLDEVFQFDGWKTEYNVQGDDVICRLSVKANGEWIYKEDGAPKTKIESFKGGLSNALKRVASSGYGIGRYLYFLDEFYAEISMIKPTSNTGWNRSKHKDKKTGKETVFWWKAPQLPKWATQDQKELDERVIAVVEDIYFLAKEKGINEMKLRSISEKVIKSDFLKEEDIDKLQKLHLHIFKMKSEKEDE